MTTLYLVRHAHSQWQPSEQRPLSAEGVAQSYRVAEVLAECRATAIFSSPFRRAVQTVEPLARRLRIPVQVEKNLRERLLSPEHVADFEAAVRRTWFDFSYSLPGGESNAAAQQRIVSTLRRIAAAHHDSVVVSTHGNVLALALAVVDSSIRYDFWRELTFPDIIRLDVAEPLARSQFRRVWPCAT